MKFECKEQKEKRKKKNNGNDEGIGMD